MSRKTPPLSVDSKFARAQFLQMLDTLEGGVDAIEACKNATQRAQAIAELRLGFEYVRKGFLNAARLDKLATEEQSLSSSGTHAAKAKHARSNLIKSIITRDWDSIPKDERPTLEVWAKIHRERILKEAKCEDLISDEKFAKTFQRWVNPSERKNILPAPKLNQK